MSSSASDGADADTPRFGRVLLKLSGEALMGKTRYGISAEVVGNIANELVEIANIGIQLAVVVGGGNIFRGVSQSAAGMDRATADYMGMLATVMNAVALQDAIEKLGLPPAFKARSKCRPWQNRTFDAGQYAT